jgi:sigma-B regulation protein RsbU (phosphoserine phosphatase)
MLNQGVLILDDQQTIVYSNACVTEITGYRTDEVVGRSVGQFYQDGPLEFLHEQMARSVNDGRNRYEFFLPRKDGVHVPIIISARRVRDDEGRGFAVVTLTDIADLKRTEDQLKTAYAALHRRTQAMEAELTLASRVQHSLVPKSITWGNITVESFYRPARMIGGDFGVASALPAGQLRLLVCDVTGHGISSALIANRIYTETMSLFARELDVGSILRELNAFVVHLIQEPGFYFTMTVGLVSQNGKQLHVAGGGHPPVLWMTPGGEHRRIEARGALLGIFEHAVPADVADEIPLSRGDRVVFYTDGLSEVFDYRGEELGVDGLEEIARRHAGLPAASLKDAIIRDVERWRDGPQTDDMSLLILERQ